ncbi:MAG: phosphoadenosine phosphosulfate reductase family protein [Gammaproteobacteria bacterium]
MSLQLARTGSATSDQDLERFRSLLADRPAAAIIDWALERAQNPVISTNFRPRSAVLLHLVTQARPDIPVIWVDTGYNTLATYRFVEDLTRRLNLNLQVYAPRVTSARRYAVLEGVPTLDDPGHEEFTREVKLEPFERALRELRPDHWFTGIRAEHNEFRRSLGVVSRGPFGVVRVAPLHAWSDADMAAYLAGHGLPDNPNYVDPTKVLGDRECGLQNLGSGI